MNLEKIENTENKIEELNKTESTDLFRSIVMGMDVTEWIDTSKGKFKVKFPRARDLEAAGKLTAIRLKGIPATSFNPSVFNFIEDIAYLDVVIIDWPDWWKLAKKENPDFGWKDIPSDDFILEVYAKAYNFRLETQKKIDGDKKETNIGMDADRNNNAASQSGLFDGVSGKS